MNISAASARSFIFIVFCVGVLGSNPWALSIASVLAIGCAFISRFPSISIDYFLGLLCICIAQLAHVSIQIYTGSDVAIFYLLSVIGGSLILATHDEKIRIKTNFINFFVFIFIFGDIFYLGSLVYNDVTTAKFFANESQFSEEGVWSLNRFFVGTATWLLFNVMIGSGRVVLISIFAVVIINALVFQSRICFLTILLAALLSKRRAAVFGLGVFLIAAFFTNELFREGVSMFWMRVLLIGAGSDNRFSSFDVLDLCRFDATSYMVGGGHCAQALGIGDVDTMWLDIILWSGVIPAAVLIFGYFLVFSSALLRQETSRHVVLLLMVWLVATSFYDSSIGKPEFYSALLLLTVHRHLKIYEET